MTPPSPAVTELSVVPRVAPDPGGMYMVTAGREAQMVQMSMSAAKRFPRDEMVAIARIKRACQRPRLAEASEYSYKKGNEVINGPTIRLAEAIAQNWGNIDVSWFEVERRQGESVVLTQAIDLETNSRKSIVFNVRHWRDTKSGGYALTDERDIYELLANQAQRRVRACILAVIPGDVVEEALEECSKTTQRAAGDKPLADRIRDMMVAFANDFGVSREMLEGRLQHRLESSTDVELRSLRKVYASLRDGISNITELFPETKVDPAAKSSAPRAGKKGKESEPPQVPAPAPPLVSELEELRVDMKKEGLEEPAVLEWIHEKLLGPDEAYETLDEVQAKKPQVLQAALRGFNAIVRDLQAPPA